MAKKEKELSKKEKRVLSTSKQIDYLYNLEAKAIKNFARRVKKYSIKDKDGNITLNIPKPKN